MKKTIAILIAALMLLSMIPMNVFAADENVCKVPAGAEHTKDNCAAYTKIETIDPVDCKFGYTLYSCDACGTVFADDFVQNENGHKWKTEKAATAATCTEPAYKELQKCEVCKIVHPELNGEAVKDSKPLGGNHDWKLPADLKDCLVAEVEQTCAKCGLVQKVTIDSHTYNEYPDADTLKVPTCTEDGSATFSCTVCDHVKTVVFKAVGHKEEIIPGKAADGCPNPAVTEGKYCTVCGEITKAPQTGIAKDCDWELTSTKTPATCDKDGVGIYTCTVCGKTKEAPIPAAHIYGENPNHTSPATCTAWGFDFYYCTVCGYLKPFEDADRHAPLGHVSYADSKDAGKYEIVDSCLVVGEQNWDCDRCGEAQKNIIDNVKGHNVVTKNVEAYCHQFSFTVDYCTNPTCDIAKVTTDPVSGMDLTMIDKDGIRLVDYVDATDATKNHNAVYNIGTEKNPDKHNLLNRVVNPATCTAPGAKYDYCPHCSYQDENLTELPIIPHTYNKTPDDVITSTICGVNDVNVFECTVCGFENKVEVPNSADHAAHKFSVEHKANAPTCLVPGNKAYKSCEYCGAADSEYTIAKVDHNWITKTTVAQCDGTKGETWQECEWCATKNAKFTVITSEYTYEATKTYETLADAKKVHAGIEDEADGEVVRTGDCYKTGLIEYACSECGKNVLVVISKDGDQVFGKHTMVSVADAEDPTCQKPGKTELFDCAWCDYTEGGKTIEKVGHKMKDFVCGDGKYCEFNCGTTEGTGYMAHNIQVKATLVADCVNYGYVHMYCTQCEAESIEYLTAYVKELGHDYSVKITEQDSTCTVEGHTAGVKCSRCGDWQTKSEPIPLKDHANKDGVKLYDKCTDTTKDRVCATCKATIGQSHTKKPGTEVKADCNSEGYTLVGCEDCGLSELTDFVPMTEHTWSAWKIEKPATILEEGYKTHYCTVCKAEGIETVEGEVIPVTAPIGIVLDANNAAAAAGETFTDSSMVALTITLDSAKLDVWGVAFDVVYSENLQFVKAEFSADNKFVVNPAAVDNNVDEKNNNPADYVSISAFAPNTEDKKVQNVALEGKMELVTLYFTVVNGDVAGNVPATATFSVVNSEVVSLDKNLNGVEIDAIDGAAAIAIVKFMDYNADGDVTLQDVLAASKILSGELTVKNDKNEDVAVTYDVALDVDKDGEITAADLLAILDYINGAKSYADVTA